MIGSHRSCRRVPEFLLTLASFGEVKIVSLRPTVRMKADSSRRRICGLVAWARISARSKAGVQARWSLNADASDLDLTLPSQLSRCSLSIFFLLWSGGGVEGGSFFLGRGGSKGGHFFFYLGPPHSSRPSPGSWPPYYWLQFVG